MIYTPGRMRFVLERVSDPDIEPVSAAEFVRNVGEFQAAATERADDIASKIKTAREWAEKSTNRALIDQTWRLTLSDQINGHNWVTDPAPYYYGWAICQSEIPLRISPVIAITSFVSVDSAGTETEVDPDTYELREADSKWPKLVGVNGGSWSYGTYRIEFRAGYANLDVSPPDDASKVPARFRQAILLYAEALYDRDEKMMPLLMETAANLIEPENCNTGIA